MITWESNPIPSFLWHIVCATASNIKIYTASKHVIILHSYSLQRQAEVALNEN
jgi:hypothetical protein